MSPRNIAEIAEIVPELPAFSGGSGKGEVIMKVCIGLDLNHKHKYMPLSAIISYG